MTLSRKDQLDITILLALERLALSTEQHCTEVKQLKLEISIKKLISKLLPDSQPEDTKCLEDRLIETTRTEILEEELIQLLSKNISKTEEDAQKIQQVPNELKEDVNTQKIEHIERKLYYLNRERFWLTGEAKDIMLCIAAHLGLNETLSFLLENGANTSFVLTSSSGKHSCVYPYIDDFFYRHSNREIQLVREKLVDKYPLQLALEGSYLVTAENLIQAKANINAIFNNKNSTWFQFPTLLYFASEKGDLTSVKFLASHGADLDATDKHGYTALHRAAWGNHITVVESLLKAGANPNIRAQGNGNRTAADFGSRAIRAYIKTYQNTSCTASCTIM